MATFSFQGIGSGIDGAGIARTVFESLTLQNEPRKNQIDSLMAENNSLEELGSLLSKVASSLDALRTSNGGASATKAASSSNEDVATAVADSSVEVSSFDVEVNTLASNASGSFNEEFSSGDELILANPANGGDVQFTVGTGEDAQSFSVQVDETTSASDFVNQFNAAAGDLASATLVQVDADTYKIAFNTNQEGTAEGSLSITSENDALLHSFGGSTVDQATDAVFQISGVAGEFTRPSNTVDDAVEGVTLQLNQVGAATISISDDPSALTSSVESFVSTFNSLVEFVNREDAVTVLQEGEGAVNIAGSLSQTNVDDSAVSALRSALSSATSADGSISFASLGVSTERDGTLSFDRDAFEETFSENPEAVTEAVTALADSVSGVEGVAYQYTGFGLGVDSAIAANDEEILNLNETIARVERGASQREQAILKQFTSLEGLIAQLNSSASALSGLLQF